MTEDRPGRCAPPITRQGGGAHPCSRSRAVPARAQDFTACRAQPSIPRWEARASMPMGFPGASSGLVWQAAAAPPAARIARGPAARCGGRCQSAILPARPAGRLFY